MSVCQCKHKDSGVEPLDNNLLTALSFEWSITVLLLLWMIYLRVVISFSDYKLNKLSLFPCKFAFAGLITKVIYISRKFFVLPIEICIIQFNLKNPNPLIPCESTSLQTFIAGLLLLVELFCFLGFIYALMTYQARMWDFIVF